MPNIRCLSLLCLLALAAVGCKSSKHTGGTTVPTADDDGGESICIDRDHDGYGKYCDLGSDCDDNDPKVTDQCRRCLSPAKDCPCMPGTTAQRCTPPIKHVDGGVLVCQEGSRYCRDSYWSDCETIGQYVFVADKP
jgi:hypothetical protein